MRLLLFFFSSSVIIATVGQNTTDPSSTETTTTVTSTTTQKNSTRDSSTTSRYQRCGSPGETDVCHYEDNMKEVCDVCFGVVCPQGQRCAKREGHCESECVCVRPGEVPDQDGICRVGCGSNPCHNNGTCRIQGSRQICDCADGYDGPFCKNVKNLCLEEQPSLCPTGAYECVMNSVNNYSCYCAAGYFANKSNHCVKVSHSVKIEMHFIETPYWEVYNDPAREEYNQVRDTVRYPFEYLYEKRLVALEFKNFTQGSLVANLLLHLKSAENGSRYADEYIFKNHLLLCAAPEQTDSPECFGKLGRVFLSQDAWIFQDERCDNVLCPTSTQCEAIDGQPDETRCICATGYEGYGSVMDARGTVVELCRDIDECKTIVGICREGETCLNTPGSFECTTPCKDFNCPGYARCVATSDGHAQCECSWIYAGSACSFPWTLIFLSLSGVLLLSTGIAAFLLWRSTAADRKGRGRQRIHPHVITVNQ